MTVTSMVLVVGLVVAYSLLGRRLESWNLSAPMLFLLAGFLFFEVAGEALVDQGVIRLIAEITLVVVLFHDASSVRLGALRKDTALPLRLLLIGFPLAILLTVGTTYWLIPGIGLAGAVLLAGALTPTDAGLGAPTVMNPKVPARIRRTLNVESGLNDGLATPVVLLALASLATDEGTATPPVLQVTLVPVLLALGLALISGFGVAWCVDASQRRGLSSHRGRALAVVATPLLIWGCAEIIEANGFIAAFVGGLIFGARSQCLRHNGEATELLETSADLLSYVIWFLAGELVVTAIGIGFEWHWLLLAVLVLTVLRIGPVLVSLLGSGLRMPSALFVGWFGPRGLATVIFALLAIEELGPESEISAQIIGITATTVVLSVIAHGATARPLAQRLGAWAAGRDDMGPSPHPAPGGTLVHSRGRPVHHHPDPTPIPARAGADPD